MAETTQAGTRQRKRDWRNRETRASAKYVAKRITEQEHAALAAYARAQKTDVAKLIAPAIQEVVQRAMTFCNEHDVNYLDSVDEAKAS